MYGTRKVLYPIICIFMLVLWMGIGCDTDDGVNGDVDCDRAADLVIAAGDSLGRQLNEIINVTLDNPDSSIRPRDVDFSGVNSIYNEAATICPSNLDAQFGAAFSGLMLFLVDEDLNDLINRIKFMIDTSTSSQLSLMKMFPVVELGGPLAPNEIPLRKSEFNNILPSLISLDAALIASAAGDPMFSEVQAILESSLLPKLEISRNKLTQVLGNANYTFTITPDMQGNDGASPIVLDRSDFSLFLAIINAGEAILHVISARNLDMTAYTADGLIESLAQESSFLGLREGGVGAGHMASAKTRLLAAEVELENSIDYLLAEINTDQTNDMIKVYPSDEEDLVMLKDSLMHYRTYFVNPVELDVSIYGWDTTLTVDIRKFFDNPMDNPKEYLPGYGLTSEPLGEMTLVCYAWGANSFEEWTWPDPTFNGLLPGMTSDQLKDFLTNSDFIWAKQDCETFDF